MNIIETVLEILADVIPEPNSRLEDQVFNAISEKHSKAQRATNICRRHTPRNTPLPRKLFRTVMKYNIAYATTDQNDLKTIVEVGTAALIDNFIKQPTQQSTDITKPHYFKLWIDEAIESHNEANLHTLNKLHITLQLIK